MDIWAYLKMWHMLISCLKFVWWIWFSSIISHFEFPFFGSTLLYAGLDFGIPECLRVRERLIIYFEVFLEQLNGPLVIPYGLF